MQHALAQQKLEIVEIAARFYVLSIINHVVLVNIAVRVDQTRNPQFSPSIAFYLLQTV